jgi:hypothetical protein
VTLVTSNLSCDDCLPRPLKETSGVVAERLQLKALCRCRVMMSDPWYGMWRHIPADGAKGAAGASRPFQSERVKGDHFVIMRRERLLLCVT